jgi:hypothetical protein
MGAAFAAWKRLGDERTVYIGREHSNGKSPPPNLAGKHVAILDFSYSAAQMDVLLRQCASVVVIDHHASAKDDLQTLPAENKIFEMRSKFALVWQAFLLLHKHAFISLQFNSLQCNANVRCDATLFRDASARAHTAFSFRHLHICFQTRPVNTLLACISLI